MTSAAMAGTLIGSASRKNEVTGLAPSIAADSKTSLRQAAHEVAQQEDRERQAVRRVRQPDRQERAGDAERWLEQRQDRDERRLQRDDQQADDDHEQHVPARELIQAKA